MPITYPRPVGPNDRYVLFKISTQEILNNDAVYPRTDGGELQGADPDLLYLHKVEPFPEPDYDSRHRQLVVDHTVDQDNGEYIRTYTTQVRPNDERTQAAEDEESFQFQRHFPVERVALHTAIMVGLIYEFTVNQQSIPAKFQPFATAYRNRVKDKVLPNFDRLNAIIADIEAGNEPDMDSGWSDPNA